MNLHIKYRAAGRLRFSLLCGLLLLAAGGAVAQMPHRVAVLVNENSQDSKKAANVFAHLHGIPGINLIYLDVPASMVKGRAECSPEEFRRVIYEPAQRELETRGLAGQIHAWVYSVDFPIRVVTDRSDRRQMSLMGLTFTRGKVPDLDLVEQGRFPSPLFAGPMREDGPKNPPRSFDVLSASLRDAMPLPSMMLGYTGENGTDMETVLRTLENGVRARQTAPGAPILFVVTDDEARSKPREWQYNEVRTELIPLKRTARIVTNQPPAETAGVLGVMIGAERVTPARFGPFAPGAMAEHLTSWSAEFQRPQTKCTEWLKAGATVTAGMVTEPYNVWTKFPHARFFVHYASGCTAMESFYQSIASPAQVLLLGNPLSQIVALPVEIQAVGLRDVLSETIDDAFVAQAKSVVPGRFLFSALLNGRQIHSPYRHTQIELPFEEMGDGYHEIRVIAQLLNPVSPGGFKDFPIRVDRKGRMISIAAVENSAPGEVRVQANCPGPEYPVELKLLWNGRELDRQPYRADAFLSFKEEVIGEGPHRIQVTALYEDGMVVRSEPHSFGIVLNPDSREAP